MGADVENAIAETSMTVEGRTLAYLDAGAGRPAIVAVHGIGSSARSWRRVMARLSGDHRMLAWDMPGYGGSDPIDIDQPVAADYAPTLDALVAKAGDAPVIMLGHSLGALLTAAYARLHPDRVACIVLSAPALGNRVKGDDPWPEGPRKRVDDLKRLGAAAFAAERAPRMAAPGASAEARQALEQEMARVRLPGYGQAVSVLAHGDLEADLAAIDRPVRIMVGDQDVVTPPEPIEAMAGRLGLPFSHLSGVGHGSHTEDPDQFTAAVAAAVEAMR